ncbi:MAG: hypothetical protein JSU04_14700 [Bdellovibrionales bacterium]|nr:hypothetical protein [Bdellovibrionales bacterium]
MKLRRAFTFLVVSLFATSNAFAVGSDAVASGAAAKGGGAASSGPSPIVVSVDAIAAMVPAAASAQAILTIPGLAQMQAGKAEFATSNPACAAQQLQAETICREKTNPDLQKTAMVINGLISGMNALNDSCSTSSKVMALASGALTAYTAACGMLRFRCEKTCTTANGALVKIQESLAQSATCAPMNPVAGGVCAGIIAKYTAEATKLNAAVTKELNPADPTVTGGRLKLCTHEYAGLLISAGLGIMSVAKTFAQTSKCDKDTKADSSSSSSGAGSSTGTGSSGSSSSATVTPSPTPTPVGTVPLSLVEQTGTYAGTASSGTSAETGKVGLAPSAMAQKSRETASAVAADSPYRSYLPGGDKDPSKAAAATGNANIQREITSANGKNNFEKIRESFRNHSKSLLTSP